MDAAHEANLYRTYEKQRLEAARPRLVLPVTIITGFLGAGKTTLLRRILRFKKNLRVAAMVNEYGLVDHDGGVVQRDGLAGSVEKLAGGCVCCEEPLGSALEAKIGELLARPDHANDRYDYLMIETSGVTDPESIIRALDKKFGKLTRARLDSVVVVVDSDFLYHQMEHGRAIPVSLRKQLENADVIVLNKADLLDAERLAELSSKVSAINPLAQVTSCSYGQVPLHMVLDVEAPRTDIQGVSHERVETFLHVSSSGGNLRKASSTKRPSPNGARRDSHGNGCAGGHGPLSMSSDSTSRKGHLKEDGLEQITFTAQAPLSLVRFQDWVSRGMPAGAIRAKGILGFDEDRLIRSVFNMSGRRRLSIEQDGHWDGPLRVHLVVIGVGMDKDQVLASLEALCVRTSTPRAVGGSLTQASGSERDSVEAQVQRFEEVLRADPVFDLVPREAEPTCPSHVVRFRFTGRGAYGLPPSQLSIKFGINFSNINQAVLRAVNGGVAVRDGLTANSTGTQRSSITASSDALSLLEHGDSPRIFLTSQHGVSIGSAAGDDDCVVLRYAFGGRVSISEGWAAIVERTREVMAQDLGHVHFCQCFS